MKRKSSVLGVVAACLLATGCANATFTTKAEPSGDVQTSWRHFLLWGLVGDSVVDVRSYCPSGTVSMVRTNMSFFNGVATALTFGIYAPRTISIQCGGAAHAESDMKLKFDRKGNLVNATIDEQPQAVSPVEANAKSQTWAIGAQARR